MVAVAAVALLLGAGIRCVALFGRAAHYRQTAAALGRREAEARQEQQERLRLAASFDRQADEPARIPRFRESARNASRLAEHHRELAARRGLEADAYASLRRVYERAAVRPWLRVSPGVR